VRILVTGGAGFIGSHLVEHHLAKGDEIWAIDNFLTGKRENIDLFRDNPLFKFSQKDLVTDNVDEQIAWAEKIYHMAAIVGYHQVLKHPLKTLMVNIKSCETIYKTAAVINPKVRILLASSSEVYGIHHHGLLHEKLPLFFSALEGTQRNYALSKYVNEMLALTYAEEKGLFSVIGRVFNTTGARQRMYPNASYVLPSFIEKALTKKPLMVYGTGKQTRSFCSVHDTVQMLDLFLTQAQNNGEIINIGNDEEITIAELAKLVAKKSNSHSEIKNIPYKEAYGIDFVDTMRRCPDLTKMKSLLGYTPKFTIEKIIEELITNFKSNHSARL
jgi:UDP-glucose 4-epimerase